MCVISKFSRTFWKALISVVLIVIKADRILGRKDLGTKYVYITEIVLTLTLLALVSLQLLSDSRLYYKDAAI